MFFACIFFPSVLRREREKECLSSYSPEWSASEPSSVLHSYAQNYGFSFPGTIENDIHILSYYYSPPFFFFFLLEQIYFFHHIVSDVFTWLGWSYAFLVRISQKRSVLLCALYRGYRVLDSIISGDVNFNHLCDVVYARFIHCERTVFSFCVGKYLGEVNPMRYNCFFLLSFFFSFKIYLNSS